MPKPRVDPEIATIRRVLAILMKLDPEARERVVHYVLARVAADERETARSAPPLPDMPARDAIDDA